MPFLPRNLCQHAESGLEWPLAVDFYVFDPALMVCRHLAITSWAACRQKRLGEVATLSLALGTEVRGVAT